MNEQAQQSLAELIKYATSGVDAMVAFGQEQLPILVEQLLMWHFVESLLWFSLGLIGLCAYIYSTFRIIPKVMSEHKKSLGDQSEFIAFGVPIFYGIGSVFLAPFLVVAVVSNIAWLKIWIAPKLYLFEYGASLVK